WFAASPGDSPAAPGSWTGALNAAESAYDANEAETSGAPQQQVVNGWYANDLAGIHADQLTAQLAQTAYLADATARIGAVLGVLALALIGDIALRAVPGPMRRY